MTIPEVDNIISVFSLLTPTQTAQVNQVKKKLKCVCNHYYALEISIEYNINLMFYDSIPVDKS